MNNNQNLQPIKTILGARLSAASQVTSEGHISCYQPSPWLSCTGQCQTHPLLAPQSSPWVSLCISSSQLINLAAGWHHTLPPWTHAWCWAQREGRGEDAAALFYFWHPPGAPRRLTRGGDHSHPGAEAISSSPGKGQEKKSWHIQIKES